MPACDPVVPGCPFQLVPAAPGLPPSVLRTSDTVTVLHTIVTESSLCYLSYQRYRCLSPADFRTSGTGSPSSICKPHQLCLSCLAWVLLHSPPHYYCPEYVMCQITSSFSCSTLLSLPLKILEQRSLQSKNCVTSKADLVSLDSSFLRTMLVVIRVVLRFRCE